MDIKLRKAKRKDCELILDMQLTSFADLLETYQDYDISPGNETIDSIHRRYDQDFTDYHLIEYDSNTVGAVRVIRIERENACRISPIFILPEFQGKNIAQNVFKLLEDYYREYRIWRLDTILQEVGNCYLYEKLGYEQTGEYEEIKAGMTIVYYEKSL